MKQFPKLIIISVLLVLTCILNSYSQNITSTGEIRAALEKLLDSQEKLMTAVQLLENNKKEIERLGKLGRAVMPGDRDFDAFLILESKTPFLIAKAKIEQKNVKAAMDKYLATTKWATDINAMALELASLINNNGGLINDSNKERSLAAISNGLSEINGSLSTIGLSTVDEIGLIIQSGRSLEVIKTEILDKIENKTDKLILDAFLDILNDAVISAGGDDSILKKVNGPLAKAMRVVKVVRIFDGDKDDLSFLVNSLDLASDLPTGNLLLMSYYIKIQKFMVEQIIEDIRELKIIKGKNNLRELKNIFFALGLGRDRIQGDGIKWTSKGLVVTEMFGRIPPEPMLSLNKPEPVFFVPGEKITVSFEGSWRWIDVFGNEDKGWVGLVPSKTKHGSSDDSDDVVLEKQYLQSEFGSLTFTAPKESGSYDIRMFDSDPGWFEDGREVFSVSFKVGVGHINMNAYDKKGNEIKFHVGIYENENDKYIYSLQGRGLLTYDLPFGVYKFKFSVNNEDIVKKNIVVTPDKVTLVEVRLSELEGDEPNIFVETTKASYTEDEEIEVNYEVTLPDIAKGMPWAIVLAESSSGMQEWLDIQLTPKGSTLSFEKTKPGKYEIRVLFLGPSAQVDGTQLENPLAKTSFEVEEDKPESPVDEIQDESLSIPVGMGRLYLVSKDALNKIISTDVNIHAAGTKDLLMHFYGTYPKNNPDGLPVDLPPGDYDISFSTGPIWNEYKGVSVEEGKAKLLVSSGYGRLKVTAQGSPWIGYYHPGDDDLHDIGHTYGSFEVDLPPGPYDILYGQDLRRVRVHIQKGVITPVNF